MLNSAKTAIVIIASSLVALVLILIALLIILDKDPTVYVGTLTNLVGVLVSSGILAALIGAQNKKVEATREKTEQIATSVNGNTSHLINTIRELQANQPVGKHVVVDEEKIASIQADSDALTGPTPIV